MFASHRRIVAAVLPALAAAWLTGCESGFSQIDRHTAALLAETTEPLGPDAIRPAHDPADYDENLSHPRTALTTAKKLPTTNPSAAELPYTPEKDSADVMEHLEQYSLEPANAKKLNLVQSLDYAIHYSREYRFAEEEYILAALRLLIERHLWGPRFFDEIAATANAVGDEGLYDSSLDLVNEFRVTQRLPYGGEVSARALARATEDLHQRVAGEEVQSAEIILAANVPLLRGAGLVAQEDLIQLNRDLIYAARTFERFRREFLFDIARDFLDLVVQQEAIANAQRQVASFKELEARENALVKSGRQPPFEAALAAQDTLFARDRLNTQRETYQLSVDRFKVRLGIPAESALVIDPSSFDLPPPVISLDDAVRLAMIYRLDLQNLRDRLDDSRRHVDNARNALLPDLNLTGAASVATDPNRDRAGVNFEPGNASFHGGVMFGLPLDREIERINVRQRQIDLERAVREYDRFRDTIAVDVRSSIRQIDSAVFSLRLQEENVRIAELRRASIDAAPDRASARDRSEAVDGLLRAQDERDLARRDLQVAILQYLLNTDQLRVNTDGSIRLLPGMAAPGPDSVPSHAPSPAAAPGSG